MDLFVLRVCQCCEFFDEIIQFAKCLDVVVILLFNVMEVFSVGGGALLDRPCMVSKEYGCCACSPSVHLGVPSIGCVYVVVCRKLSPHLGV